MIMFLSALKWLANLVKTLKQFFADTCQYVSNFCEKTIILNLFKISCKTLSPREFNNMSFVENHQVLLELFYCWTNDFQNIGCLMCKFLHQGNIYKSDFLVTRKFFYCQLLFQTFFRSFDGF